MGKVIYEINLRRGSYIDFHTDKLDVAVKVWDSIDGEYIRRDWLCVNKVILNDDYEILEIKKYDCIDDLLEEDRDKSEVKKVLLERDLADYDVRQFRIYWIKAKLVHDSERNEYYKSLKYILNGDE